MRTLESNHGSRNHSSLLPHRTAYRCILSPIHIFCKYADICGVASAMDGGGSTQQRCFCDSKNSPSTNVHGCIFVDEVSAPPICKRRSPHTAVTGYGESFPFICSIFFDIKNYIK